MSHVTTAPALGGTTGDWNCILTVKLVSDHGTAWAAQLTTRGWFLTASNPLLPQCNIEYLGDLTDE
jgi:hypothetical protein